jgi:transcriptional regulator GlxA family with amidase domain
VLERPAHPHSVQTLAVAAGMSRTSFAERFAAAFGRSPLDFVRRVRLRDAARLLATTALPVKLVAASVGYASRSRFSQAFRESYGVDPTTYRAEVGARHDTSPGDVYALAGDAGPSSTGRAP